MGTLDCPKPEQRGRDIDAAISGVGAAGFVGRHLRQQPGKQRENDKPRQQPQRRAVEPPPRPKGKATGDLAESGERINEIGAHSSDSLSASAASVTRRNRSEERRVGKEWVSTCIYRGSPNH